MNAIAYIDGFNLYYGSLKSTADKWLDIQALAAAITPKHATLTAVRYFTAKVKPSARSPSAHTDQAAYLDALAASCPLVDIKYGHFLRHKVRAENASPPPNTVRIFKTEEKGSDVNLAVHLLNDVWGGVAKVVVLISNDSDLAEAVQLAQARGVRVYWFPPVRNPKRRPSVELCRVVSDQRSIYPSLYTKCQLPNPVPRPNGAICKPTGW
jgi:uncharacterized LabA/DUF88 family protein